MGPKDYSALSLPAMPMTERRRLSDIADIKPGYSFRSKIEHDPQGSYFVIQPSNVGAGGGVDVADLSKVRHITPREYHMVDAEAVLFIAYGTRNRVYHFERLPANTVASSTFYLLRPKLHDPGMAAPHAYDVLPGYLTWYLNQPPAQAYFDALRGGASVQMLRRDALGSLEIPVPPLDIQRQVATVARLALEEEQLTRQLMEKRRMYIDNLLLAKTQHS